MFVRYSFVERRRRSAVRLEPFRSRDTAVMALGIASMTVISLGYAITSGL